MANGRSFSVIDHLVSEDKFYLLFQDGHPLGVVNSVFLINRASVYFLKLSLDGVREKEKAILKQHDRTKQNPLHYIFSNKLYVNDQVKLPGNMSKAVKYFTPTITSYPCEITGERNVDDAIDAIRRDTTYTHVGKIRTYLNGQGKAYHTIKAYALDEAPVLINSLFHDLLKPESKFDFMKAKDADGNTPLHCALKYLDEEKFIAYVGPFLQRMQLLSDDQVAEIFSMKDADGNTVMHLAATKTRKIFEFLIQNIKDDILKRLMLIHNKRDQTPYLVAREQREVDVVVALKLRMLIPDAFAKAIEGKIKDSKNLLHHCFLGSIVQLAKEEISFLMTYDNLILKDSLGNTPLHYAVKNLSEESLGVVIKSLPQFLSADQIKTVFATLDVEGKSSLHRLAASNKTQWPTYFTGVWRNDLYRDVFHDLMLIASSQSRSQALHFLSVNPNCAQQQIEKLWGMLPHFTFWMSGNLYELTPLHLLASQHQELFKIIWAKLQKEEKLFSLQIQHNSTDINGRTIFERICVAGNRNVFDEIVSTFSAEDLYVLYHLANITKLSGDISLADYHLIMQSKYKKPEDGNLKGLLDVFQFLATTQNDSIIYQKYVEDFSACIHALQKGQPLPVASKEILELKRAHIFSVNSGYGLARKNLNNRAEDIDYFLTYLASWVTHAPNSSRGKAAQKIIEGIGQVQRYMRTNQNSSQNSGQTTNWNVASASAAPVSTIAHQTTLFFPKIVTQPNELFIAQMQLTLISSETNETFLALMPPSMQPPEILAHDCELTQSILGLGLAGPQEKTQILRESIFPPGQLLFPRFMRLEMVYWEDSINGPQSAFALIPQGMPAQTLSPDCIILSPECRFIQSVQQTVRRMQSLAHEHQEIQSDRGPTAGF